MLNDILFAVLRSAAAFILLLTMSRILGRKALSQMTFFDFTVVITFGSVAANMGLGQGNSFHTAVSVLVTLGILGLFSGILHVKSFRFRKMVNSEPLVLIKDGQIIEPNMRKGRISVSELTSMLRYKNVYDFSDVHYAILENSGSLSVLPVADKKPLTPKDMQITPVKGGLTKDVIIDGTVMKENLSATNVTVEWLMEKLKENEIYDAKRVFYAGLAPDGTLYISKKTRGTKEAHGQHGIE